MPMLLDRFLSLIGYRAPLQEGPHGRRLWLDRIAVDITEDQTGLTLWSPLGTLPQDPALRQPQLQQLAWIATARSVEEDWVLSYEERSQELFLWGKLDAGASEEELPEAMESFVATAEWWQHRLQDQDGQASHTPRKVTPNPWDDTGLMTFRP